MTDPRPVPLEAEPLLHHVEWLRSLARTLVRDAHAADDAAQETLTAALEQPPTQVRSWRAWLRSILRHVVARSRARERMRPERESRAARAEAQPAAAALAERVAEERRLVDRVLSLPEPYRTTVLLRFWEGLPPRGIARRMGCPVATVRARLQRGLARLRGVLDRDFGQRNAWVPVLAGWHAGTSAPAGGVLLLSAKLALAAVLLAAAAWWLVPAGRTLAASGDPCVSGFDVPNDPALLGAGLSLQGIGVQTSGCVKVSLPLVFSLHVP